MAAIDNQCNVKNIIRFMNFLHYDKYEIPSSIVWPQELRFKYGEDVIFYFNKAGDLSCEYTSRSSREGHRLNMFGLPKDALIISRCFYSLVDEVAKKIVRLEMNSKITNLHKLLLRLYDFQFIENHCYLNSYI